MKKTNDHEKIHVQKEYVEALLLDFMDGKLTEDQQLELQKIVERFPDLKNQYHLMLLDSSSFYLSENYKASLTKQFGITSEQLLQFEHKLDQESMIQDSIPQIKRMIYSVIIPAIAASLLLFFQWGSNYIATSEQRTTDFELDGQIELVDFERSMTSYAGLEELDELVKALNTLQN
jgi:hypothetical protein